MIIFQIFRESREKLKDVIVDGRTLSNKTLCQSDPLAIAKPLLKPCKMSKIHSFKILRQVVLRPISSFKFCRKLFLHTISLPSSLPFKLTSISDHQIWFYEINERVKVCIHTCKYESKKGARLPQLVAATTPRNDQLGIEKWRRQGLKTKGLTSQKSIDLRKIKKLTNFVWRSWRTRIFVWGWTCQGLSKVDLDIDKL